MPCSGPSYDVHSEYRSQIAALQDELDLTTRLLCRTMRRTIKDAKKRGVPVKDDPIYRFLIEIPEMRKWWKDHKALDRQRKQKEIQDAKNKLREAKQEINRAKKVLERAKAEVEVATKTLKAKAK